MPTDQAVNPLLASPIIPFLFIFIIFYFLVIKPEKAKQKERKDLLAAVKKNDEIVTASGIHGTVVNVKDNTVIVRVDDNTKIEFDKESVSYIKKPKS